jgi:hypothetical protein
MRAVALLVLLGAASSLTAAPAPLARRERAEKPPLVGEWKLLSAPALRCKGGLSVAGDQLILSLDVDGDDDQGHGQHARFTPANSRTTSGTIDLHFYLIRWRRKGDQSITVTLLSIYRIEGDVLTLVMGTEQRRPTGFDPDSGQVFVFRRVGR